MRSAAAPYSIDARARDPTGRPALRFGSHFFSNLLHYVRTGDFVDALISDAQDINEYAFALGALGHYLADNNGLIATPLPGSGGDGETRSARIRLELASLTVTQSSMIAH